MSRLFLFLFSQKQRRLVPFIKTIVASVLPQYSPSSDKVTNMFKLSIFSQIFPRLSNEYQAMTEQTIN